MFVEKYRPIYANDMVGQDHIIDSIRKYVKKNDIIPHMLFEGPPGTGKTSLALIISKQFFGKDLAGSFLELNASSERGIDIIKNQVKDFAKTKSFHSFKIVFLDEASEITKDAQNALRRLMERYHQNCRFILSANYPEKIIQPIKSRCKIYKFKRISEEALKILVKKVAKEEGIKLKKKLGNLIIKESNGDARRALHLLEAIKNGENINEDIIEDVFGLEIEEFIEAAYVYNPEFLLRTMVDSAIKMRHKKIVIELATLDFKMRNGTIKSLQLISSFIKIKKYLG
jgi:replication factor C small subunit